MATRSDFALELQLDAAKDQATSPGVESAIESALTHMSGSGSRNRRGGKRLVSLLEEARSIAAKAGDWQVVRLLQDSLDYAEGRILKPEFEERYRLFQDGQQRNDILRDYVSTAIWGGSQFLGEKGKKFLADTPGADADDLLAHLLSLGQDSLFLEAPPDRPGRYRIPRGRAEMALWLERALKRERIDVDDAADEAYRIAASPGALELLAADADGQMIFRAAELQRRSAGLNHFRKVAEDRASTEHDLQIALEGQYWIFGGNFVGEAAQRRLVPGDEIDIPLIRGDGSLHIVELKRSMSLSGPLVKEHRGTWVPTSAVHDAVGQAINYLVGLDENRQTIYRDLGIETRRASAIVLVGHPGVQPDVPESEINEALRTFNSHMSRVEVLTYKELIDNAERSLGAQDDGSPPVAASAEEQRSSPLWKLSLMRD
ncbi:MULTISPECIES: Shedu anti-phage system protein SduA domain-containing protein [Streptomyces griseus group]|uniref:Shedu anti-phage system protein SduA domain-containing protein n=1 Tax=Streptomyces griseus group TaxID=629295 RepID=UPI0030820348